MLFANGVSNDGCLFVVNGADMDEVSLPEGAFVGLAFHDATYFVKLLIAAP